jgi:hypothetical protein
MRDLENTTPLSDGTLIRQLKLQTATEEDLQGRWKDAMMCVQSNKERFMMNEQIVFRKALEFRDVVITWDNEITLPIDIPNEIEAAIRTKFSSVLRGVFLKNAPIMLTENVSPILQVANGTPAILHSLIILDPEARATAMAAISNALPMTVVKLAKRPDFVVVKLDLKMSYTVKNSTILNLNNFLFPESTEKDSYLVPIAYLPDRFGKNNIKFGMNESGKASLIKYKKFNFDLAYAVTAYKLQGATIKYLLIDLNQRPSGLKPMDLRSLYVILSRVAYLCRIRIMPFRPHTNKGNINNQNYLDYLKQLSQSPELAAWHRCIDPVTFLFDPSKYVKPVKGKKAPSRPAQTTNKKFKKGRK